MLVESACELDDDLINKYLEGEEITPEELAQAISQGVREQKLFPVVATAGSKSVGLEPLLNAITQLLPSPVDVETKLANGSALRGNDKLTFNVQADLHPASQRPPLIVAPCINQAIPLKLDAQVEHRP